MAAAEMSGPGWRPSARNSRAALLVRVAYDQENTARIWLVDSPADSASSRLSDSASSPASRARENPDSAARAATIVSASGSRAHRVTIWSTAAGSAATRSAPSRRASSSRASAPVRTSSRSG